MREYDDFITKYASYEDKYVEKSAFLEAAVQAAAQHYPLITQYLPPEGVLGLAGLAGKYALMRGASKGIGTLMNKVSIPSVRMPSGPRVNNLKKTLTKVDKASDVGTALYSGAMIGRHFL